MNASLVFGVVLQGIMAVGLAITYPVFGQVAAACEVAALAGLVLMAWRRARRWGARVVMVASLPFVPLGFLAMYGALRETDRLTEEQFQRGRRESSP